MDKEDLPQIRFRKKGPRAAYDGPSKPPNGESKYMRRSKERLEARIKAFDSVKQHSGVKRPGSVKK